MNRKLNVILVILMMIFIVTSCSGEKIISEASDSKDMGFIENKEVYKLNDPTNVKELYITVMPAKDQPPEFAYTFSQLNNDIDGSDDVEVEVRVLLQEGKGGVPSAGYYSYGITSANAIMKLRGQTSRLADLKSYKVNIDEASGPWNGFSVLNLNKHPYDSVKIRNKIALDYLKDLPGMTSLRTQFVHLYIRDLSEGNYSKNFEDYGLFTQVENLDTDYLKNHGLDDNGSLYKAENFEFYRYENQLKLIEDHDYKKKEFEKRLEIKGNEDHSKLLRMLDDVNNNFTNISDIINKHFDRENYITWMAANILLGNIDTTTRNFYLYSPSKSNRWYFLPWDLDGCLRENYTAKGPWQKGVSNYWGSVLHQRFLKVKQNREDLTLKIEELSKAFSEENTRNIIQKYQPIVEYFMSREPDLQEIRTGSKPIQEELQGIPKLIEKNKKEYYESLEAPLPVFMGKPIELGDYFIFKWDNAYDFQNDYIKYSIQISKTPDFKNIVYEQTNILDSQCSVKKMPPGKYYWKLKIYDSQGNYQEAFDFYNDRENDVKYYGIQEFFSS